METSLAIQSDNSKHTEIGKRQCIFVVASVTLQHQFMRIFQFGQLMFEFLIHRFRILGHVAIES